MPSNAPPSPFPFLPVVLESPVGAQGRAMSSPDGTACMPEPASRRLARGAPDTPRGKGRTPPRRRLGAVQNVPGLSLGDGGATLRVEVVRRIDPAGVALLGAIVR
ncbi:hypothetical protein PCE31106_00961 [Pandoraea cepalis]|uniref:Uncharacterized protein n=3 Tax=Pandoraea TaxID=93217 RepID=A0A5E4SUX2_9BURK|nr:hypothetical protein [Pandoraea sp. NE5]BDD92850.1 hypothetical protein PanNE5_22900 [Pandoraea sp. NE5]VVD78218.1 hypothetical protein PCE31106_00961 [Pandoraea cepalis]